MSLKQFALEKVIANLLIWLCAFSLGGLAYKNIPGAKPVQWGELFDVWAVAIFAVGTLVALVIGYAVSKFNKAGNQPWLLAKIREEASTAIVNISSIGLCVAMFVNVSWMGIVGGLLGFIAAFALF